MFDFTGKPNWTFNWAKFFGYNNDLRNCVIDSRNKHYAHCWLNNINDDPKDCFELSMIAHEK